MSNPATSSRPRDAHRLARWIVGLGVLAATALVVVAFTVVREPGEGARAAFLQLCAELGAAVQEEWGRFRVGLGRGGVAVGDVARSRDARELADSGARSSTTFDALVGEARQLELRRDEPARALELLRDALERAPDTGLDRRAEAILRALALAGVLGDAEAAWDLWTHAERALEGHETRRGWSYLLLAGLAAAPSLSEERAALLGETLLARWRSGALVMPPATPRLGAPFPSTPAESADLERAASAGLAAPLVARWTFEDQGARSVSLQALRALVVGEAGGGAAQNTQVAELSEERHDDWDRAQELAKARELLRHWDRPLPAPGPVELTLHREGELLLALQRDAEGVRRAALFDATSVGVAFAEAAASNLAIPEGFALDLGRAEDSLGTVVRGRAELEAGLGFALRHRDPESAMLASSRRLLGVRAGLILGALLCLVAAWFTARALRREARLTQLRRAFVASVSHELRTPVASILLLADNLREGVVEEPAAVRRYHALIGREARRLSRLVNDVLDMSRLDRGEPARVRLSENELAEFARSLDEDLAELSAKHEVELSWLAAPPGRARFDTEGLRRAILNLVENAMIHGGGPVHLSGTGDDDHWQLTVRDHGAGVAPARRARLFEAFEHDGESGGTGLGLAIVAALAEAHGGQVELCDPEAGPGAVFRLSLPRDGGAARPAESQP